MYMYVIYPIIQDYNYTILYMYVIHPIIQDYIHVYSYYVTRFVKSNQSEKMKCLHINSCYLANCTESTGISI